MTVSHPTRCRKRQQSYLPTIMEDDACMNQTLILRQPIQSPAVKEIQGPTGGHAGSASFLQESNESLAEIYSIVRREMKEFHCLPNSFIFYMIFVKTNLIHSSTHLNSVLNFLRYYPIILGWIYLALKCKSFVDQNKVNPNFKSSRSNGSTDTCETADSNSSCSSSTSRDSSDLPFEEDSQLCGPGAILSRHAAVSHSSPAIYDSIRRPQALEMKSQFCSWGYFSDLTTLAWQNSNSSSNMEPESIADGDAKTHALVLNNLKRLSAYTRMETGSVSEDWGYFMDFPEEISRPNNPPLRIVEKKKNNSLLHGSRYYYDICVKFVQMFTPDDASTKVPF